MSADFWSSTHCAKWLRPDPVLNYRDLVNFVPTANTAVMDTDTARDCNESPGVFCTSPEEHNDDDVGKQQQQQQQILQRKSTKVAFTQAEVRVMHLFFTDYITKLCERMKLKQGIAATACVYFKRFYLEGSFFTTDPRLVAPTAIFLAGKAEECRVNLHDVLSAVHAVAGHLGQKWVPTASALMQAEFEVLEQLDFQLVVFHPYRLLTQYLMDVSLSTSLPIAWQVVNDSYRTTACLTYPPPLIAISAIYMVCSLSDKNCSAWLDSLGVDMKDVLAITQAILSLYSSKDHQITNPEMLELVSRLERSH